MGSLYLGLYPNIQGYNFQHNPASSVEERDHLAPPPTTTKKVLKGIHLTCVRRIRNFLELTLFYATLCEEPLCDYFWEKLFHTQFGTKKEGFPLVKH